jgi:hypothetical protein
MRARFVDRDGFSFFAYADETMDLWIRVDDDQLNRVPSFIDWMEVGSIARDADMEGRHEEAKMIRAQMPDGRIKTSTYRREYWRMLDTYGPMASPVYVGGEWVDLVYRYVGRR